MTLKEKSGGCQIPASTCLPLNFIDWYAEYLGGGMEESFQ